MFGILWAFNGGRIAKRKGRSVFGWVVICFFFGLIGLLILNLMPEPEKKDNSVNYYETGKTWVCVKCGANNTSDARSCEECGEHK
jgi:ribosomal protein L40E